MLFFFIIFFSQVESEIQVESSLYFGSGIQVESSLHFGSGIQVESSRYFGSETTWVWKNTGEEDRFHSRYEVWLIILLTDSIGRFWTSSSAHWRQRFGKWYPLSPAGIRPDRCCKAVICFHRYIVKVGESSSRTSQYLGDNGSSGGGISPDNLCSGDGSLNISNYTLWAT